MSPSITAKIKGSMKKLDTLEELLHEELCDIYDAENQIIDAMPKMVDAASTPQLKEAFRDHLEETKAQAERLEQVFNLFNWKAEKKTCAGMKGLLKEGEELMAMRGKAVVKDAALISAAQRVEHYEMAAYGSARTFASMVGNNEAADLLQITLDEEAKSDQTLTDIALSSVNARAA